MLKISEKLIHISVPHDMEIILDKKVVKIGIINFGTLWTIFRILEQCVLRVVVFNLAHSRMRTIRVRPTKLYFTYSNITTQRLENHFPHQVFGNFPQRIPFRLML